MAQATLQARAFRGAKSNSKTKDIADLIVAKGTNEAGKVTNPEVYNVAIDFLKGGRETEELDIDEQKKVAGYENDLKSLSNKKANSKQSVEDFRRLQDSIFFNDLDFRFRDPWVLLESTILENDRMLLDVLDSIESKSANDEDVEDLEDFSNELAQTIDELDELRTQLVNQEFTPGKKTFDTFTYALNSDPDNKGIKGATIVPTRLLPKGYQRTEESWIINGAYIPVAIPTAVDKKGKIYGSIGGKRYKASDTKTPLSYGVEKPGTFNLSDKTIYPKKPSGIANETYVRGTLGYGADNKPILGLLKKGGDGKLYSIDNDTFEQLKTNPEERQKLDGYIDTLNARDFADAYSKSEPFKYEPLQSFAQPAAPVAPAAPTPPTTFFGGTNRPTTPKEPVVGLSTPDIIEQGKPFFQSLAKPFAEGFFGKK